VIGFHLAESGYFLQLRGPGPYGGTISMSPLDAPRLAQKAEELLAAGPAHHPQHGHTW